LWDKPPIARGEEDWWKPQQNILGQVRALAEEHHCPIIYPGDIFHHWRASPELINFAIKHLPPGYSIPGQHDLPYHDYKQIKKSAYWTLVQAGVLTHIRTNVPELLKYNNRLKRHVPSVYAHGFAWGKKIASVEEQNLYTIRVAVIHKYTWTGGHSHPGALPEDHVEALDKKLHGFTCAVVGDNHSGFLYGNSKTGRQILNCGTVMRRRSDEQTYRPHVGLIHENGRIGLHYLDVESEKWQDTAGEVKKLQEMGVDIEGFVETLSLIEDTAVDFAAAVAEYVQRAKVHPYVMKIVTAAMEAARGKK
jgi:hypothetical protein